MTPPEEMFDVVDEQDRVLYQAPRSRVHAENLLHRAVHIFLFDSDGKFLLQLRSATKDQYPLCYTSSASGHLEAGENYEFAAERELLEELRITANLQWLVKLPASPETAYEHTVLYEAVSDEIPRPDPAEIASVKFVTWDELLEILAREPERFSPPFRLLVEWYTLNRPSR